jgi:hypothetical protein
MAEGGNNIRAMKDIVDLLNGLSRDPGMVASNWYYSLTKNKFYDKLPLYYRKVGKNV